MVSVCARWAVATLLWLRYSTRRQLLEQNHPKSLVVPVGDSNGDVKIGPVSFFCVFALSLRCPIPDPLHDNSPPALPLTG